MLHLYQQNKQKLEIMTIETTKKIIAELKAENLESNNELIAFYERKVKEAYINAIEKAFNS